MKTLISQARRQILAACAACALPIFAGAQATYPSKPIKIVVGFPPGQATDLIGRLLAQKLTDSLGQPVIVDNKPGKGGSIGAELAAKAQADGHTLLISATAPMATNPNLYANVGYNPLTDFEPISLMVWLPFVLVANPGLPVSNLAELIAYTKARPNALSYASSGNGSTSHLIMEMMKTLTDMKLQHVPYKGSVAALSDVMSGQLQLSWETAVSTLPHVRSGRLKAIAMSSAQRSALIPDIPAAAETLPGFSSGAWLGLLAPAGTPKEVVARLNAELHKHFKTQEVSERLATMGGEVLLSTPEEFQSHMRQEYVKWGKAVKDSGARVD